MPRLADQADPAGAGDVGRDDAGVGLRPGLAMPGQFGPMIRVCSPLAHVVRPERGGVVHRDALGDHDGERDLGVDRLDHRGLGERRRHEDDRHVGAGLLHRLGDGAEDRQLGAVEVDRLCRPCAGSRRRRRWCRRRSIRRVCLEPSEPVMPWTMTLESLVSQIAMSSDPRRRELGGALGRAVHRVHPLDERVGGRVEDPPALLGVVAVQPDDQRLGDLLAALARAAPAPGRCRWRPRRRR